MGIEEQSVFSMFPGSNTAENLTGGKTKCSYILCHRIAPFAKESIIN